MRALREHADYLHHDCFAFFLTRRRQGSRFSVPSGALSEVSRWSQPRGAHSNRLSAATSWLHLPRASLIQQLSRFNTDYLLVSLLKKKTKNPFLYFPCSLFTRADSWHARLHVKQVLISSPQSPKESNRWGKSWSNLFFFFFFRFSCNHGIRGGAGWGGGVV